MSPPGTDARLRGALAAAEIPLYVIRYTRDVNTSSTKLPVVNVPLLRPKRTATWTTCREGQTLIG